MACWYPSLCFAALAVSILLSACRGEPAPTLAPSAPAASATEAASPAPAAPAPSVSAAAVVATPAGSSLPAAPSAAAASATVAESSGEPALLGPDGTALPQTEERPSATSERFKRRMQRLAEAIVAGDAERASDVFFPLVAYSQVKDVQKPERDYRYRLMAHFARDVREYHKQLGKDAARAEFIGAEVPEERAQWMKPGKEGNRLGYFRVLRSRLRFRIVGGTDKTFELTSMISWRGEWYVVHLHGFE